jgi:hypothetical protein
LFVVTDRETMYEIRRNETIKSKSHIRDSMHIGYGMIH